MKNYFFNKIPQWIKNTFNINDNKTKITITHPSGKTEVLYYIPIENNQNNPISDYTNIVFDSYMDEFDENNHDVKKMKFSNEQLNKISKVYLSQDNVKKEIKEKGELEDFKNSIRSFF